MLIHLENLYSNPAGAWREIDKEIYKNKFDLLKNLNIFLIINPLIFFFINLIQLERLEVLFLHGLFYPFFLTLVCILTIALLSLLIEEIFKITSHRDPMQNIFKLLIFSSIPFLSMIGFMDIVYVGKILLLTGFIYSITLAFTGIHKFVWIHKSFKREIFLYTTIFIFFAIFISLFLLSGFLKYFARILF